MKERIRSVMEYAGMTQQEFALRLGISPATLSSIFTGRTNPSQKQVLAIHEAFPEINISWLMFGEGEMIVAKRVMENAEAVSAANVVQGSEAAAATGGGESAARYQGMPATSLFDAETSSEPVDGAVRPRSPYAARRESNSARHNSASLPNMAINFDKRERKIKEIRVFFDDGTYEAFVPSNK